ncbi:MAG: hypothetical protein V1889_00070 [archaeon]
MVIKKMFGLGLAMMFLVCLVFVSGCESCVDESECADSVPIYRFLNSETGGRFYTISEAEKENIEKYPAFVYEGIIGGAFAEEGEGTIPVYRFWSARLGDHFYVTDEGNERENFEKMWGADWIYEGVVFYIYEEERVNSLPVYRFWNVPNSNHIYTTDEDEKNELRTLEWASWRYEGIIGYVCGDDAAPGKVSNLGDVAVGESWILWNWSNPADDDFYLNLIYLDGVNVANVSDEFYNATGLGEDTSYTLKILTMDDSYNINHDGVSDSARTLKDEEDEDEDDNHYVILKSGSSKTTQKVVDYSVKSGGIISNSILVDSSGAVKLGGEDVVSSSGISWIFWVLLIVVVIMFLIVVGVGIRR